MVSKRTTKPTIRAKKKIIKVGASEKRAKNCSQKNEPISPCLKRPRREKSMIQKPKKTLASRRGDFILVKRKEIRRKRKGIMTAPQPKYWVKARFTSVAIVPCCKNENMESMAKIKKKIKKIDLTVSGLSLSVGKIRFFLRPRGINTV